MRVRLVLVALALPLLAGCGSAGTTTRLPTACPTPGLLAEGADLTRHRPGPVQDLTTLEFDAKLTGLSGACAAGRDDRSIEMQLTTGFSVERGAASDGRSVDLPWFVAVLDRRSDQILSRQIFVERAGFARNETRTAITSAPVTLSLPVGENRRAADYRILVSFMLSEEDLALNRRRGPR
ncbi:hypothetical protein QWZ14_03420 [Paeniroseomonas aquatica]|uniref:Lipoprotein n=1 Tax=Paeniroseomonas aquatica TaxID=373043 RepID=A0ABT8A124_9PROT|nr:hypothetical protein [Paeniroseomonas aquatica]MDN3563422.1 hypothetical protein [Paeniroseomonas aquatica]